MIDLGPSWLSKTEPRRSKIDVERASKFDQFLKASWNAIFSAQEAPRRENGAAKRSAWRNARVAWGGLRRGKTDVQTPRTLALEDRLWKDSEGPRSNHSARRPEMGGGSLRAFRRAYSSRFKARGGWTCVGADGVLVPPGAASIKEYQ